MSDESDALLARARDCLARNDLAEAVALARQVLRGHAEVPTALLLTGIAGVMAGQAKDALPLLRLTLALRPDEPAAHHALSMAFRETGNLPKACDHAETAVRAEPQNPKFLRNCAYNLFCAKRYEQSVDAYRAFMALGKAELKDFRDYARALIKADKLDDAEAVLEKASQLYPDDADTAFAQGHLYTRQRKNREAVAAFRRTIELNPNKFIAYVNLASLAIGGCNPQMAAEVCRSGLAAGGDRESGIHANYSLALAAMGKAREATVAMERSITLEPQPKLGSNLLFFKQYLDSLSTADIYELHREWNLRHARHLAPATPSHGNSPDPGRRLRIGYVSPDLRGHSCAFFLRSLYHRHDRQRFEIYSYSCTDSPDTFTQYFKEQSDHWRDLNDISDEKAAGLIRADGIDILVDLAGHSARNRMLVFARKPAPVQVTWLGYPTTTGLDTIDWRLTDAWLTPDDTTERFSERLYRLPRLSHCYTIQANITPEVQPGPCDTNGIITFGSFNNFAKVSDATLRLWAGVLAAAPEARLRLKSRNIKGGEAEESFVGRFRAAGGDVGRLDVTSGEEYTRHHLARYAEIDIALDTFPYGGMTTSCEAMSMGVPVITLLGDRTAGRYAASLLDAVGLGDLIARSPEEYAAIAARLAADRDRLRSLRFTLRERMRASPLGDEPGFTRAMEDAYRDMWGRWCEGSTRNG